MTQYLLLYEPIEDFSPPPPIIRSFFTIGATHEGDTMRILLYTIIELADLYLIARKSIDSVH
ncbi:MAG: hypothetical protein M3421_07720 [Bacteroidota bacterium]|nr:hypothetical protein [Bacteroidota bacterium]